MDLSDYVIDDPPPSRSNRAGWQTRFEQIIGQGLSGKWINASAAWGTKSGGKASAIAAAERCGVNLEWRVAKGAVFVRVK